MILHPAFFAFAVVLAASTDWAVEPAHICAKDARSCYDELRAVQEGRIAPAGDERTCELSPNCYSERSNCIKGYRGPKGRRVLPMSKGIDPSCITLAKHFLEAEYVDEPISDKEAADNIQSLARSIQEAVEDWFFDNDIYKGI